MATRSELYPSKYLKADILTEPVVAKIKLASVESLKGFDGEMKKKLVLYFHGGLPPLVCNQTNFDTIADFLGDNSDEWPAGSIELFATTADVRGQTKPAVRVRQPDQARLPISKKSPAPVRAAGDKSDMDDAIPF